MKLSINTLGCNVLNDNVLQFMALVIQYICKHQNEYSITSF